MIKLEDYDIRLLERISKRLNTKIDIKEIDNEFYIKDDELLSVLDYVYDTVDHLEDEIRDINQDIEDNYKPIPRKEQCE